jgi:hypothetical protein
MIQFFVRKAGVGAFGLRQPRCTLYFVPLPSGLGGLGLCDDQAGMSQSRRVLYRETLWGRK